MQHILTDCLCRGLTHIAYTFHQSLQKLISIPKIFQLIKQTDIYTSKRHCCEFKYDQRQIDAKQRSKANKPSAESMRARQEIKNVSMS